MVECPQCKKQYQLPDDILGKKVKCNQCGEEFRADGVQVNETAVASPEADDPPVQGGFFAKWFVKNRKRFYGEFRRTPDEQAGQPVTGGLKIVRMAVNGWVVFFAIWMALYGIAIGLMAAGIVTGQMSSSQGMGMAILAGLFWIVTGMVVTFWLKIFEYVVWKRSCRPTSASKSLQP